MITILAIVILTIFIFSSSYEVNLALSTYAIVPSSIAFITSLYGIREKTLKPIINQTIPVDFYAFVQNENIV